MHSRAAVRVMGRQLKRMLPRAAADCVRTTTQMRGGRELVSLQRIDSHVAEADALAVEDGAKKMIEKVVVASAALLSALAWMEATEAACEALHSEDATPSEYFDEDYEATQLVGSGTFGMVMQCVSKKDGHVAAVKMIQDVNDIREEVAREKDALASIQRAGGHENIVQFDGAYEHDGFHYIVTEFVEGESLFAFIQKHRQLDVSVAVQLSAQLASALSFLRTHKLIHRDLKPENVMILRSDDMKQLKLKIIDFGSSEHHDGEKRSAEEVPRAMALSGTRCYWPPEVLKRLETSPAMDMWALGCILYIMIAGRHPFDLMGSSTEDEIVHRVTTDTVSFLHPVWSSVPNNVKSLIRGLLDKDPSSRLSVDEVMLHPAMRLSH